MDGGNGVGEAGEDDDGDGGDDVVTRYPSRLLVHETWVGNLEGAVVVVGLQVVVTSYHAVAADHGTVA